MRMPGEDGYAVSRRAVPDADRLVVGRGELVGAVFDVRPRGMSRSSAELTIHGIS